MKPNDFGDTSTFSTLLSGKYNKKKKKDKYEMNSEHVWLKHSTQHQWNHFSGY